MNLKVVLKDYLDFLENKGIVIPDDYSTSMNDELFQQLKAKLDDVYYDFILDIIDEFYDDIKRKLEKSNDKICIRYEDNVLVCNIVNLNTDYEGVLRSIDVLDEDENFINIRFETIYSVEDPKNIHIEKVETKEEDKEIKDPEKHVIKEKHKYDDFIEPDLMSTRQIAIVDKPEYLDNPKPKLMDIIFSKKTFVSIVCIALVFGAIYAVKYSFASVSDISNNDVICIEGYTNVNGECVSDAVLRQETTTVARTSEIEVVRPTVEGE